MLIEISDSPRSQSLHELIQEAATSDITPNLGADIETANKVLLDPAKSHQERCDALLAWVSRHQPCLFGRFGSRGLQGIGIDVCWIDQDAIAKGDLFVQEKIQSARRRWKTNAARGKAHGFLVMFNDPRLLSIEPGAPLVAICEKISNLYLVEHAPVEPDVIYTEARRRSRWSRGCRCAARG